jgi:hypothetical protein
MKRIRLLAIPLLAVLMGIALLLPMSAGAASTQSKATTARQSGALSQTITNNQTSYNGTPALFNGTLTITKFVKQGSQLVGLGTATGTFTNACRRGIKLSLPKT